jgi:UDP-N-acetylmuramyl pentapeptide synthase
VEKNEMKRRDLNYAVIVVMFLSGLYTAFTGLVMDLLNVPLFAFHNYAGYAFAALMGLHLVLNWKRIKAFLQRHCLIAAQ